MNKMQYFRDLCSHEIRMDFGSGCLLKGFEAMYLATGEACFREALLQAAKGIAGMDAAAVAPEHLHAAKALFFAMDEDEALRDAAVRLMQSSQPMPEDAHLKAAYMILPFAMAYEMKLHGMEKVAQVAGCFRALRRTRWNQAENVYGQPSCKGDSAPCLRAHGWMLLALIDAIEACSEQLYEHYRALVDLLREGLQGLLQHCCEDGLIPHRAGEAQGDAAASLMAAYCLFKAVRLGLVDPERYLPIARRCLSALEEKQLPGTPAEDGYGPDSRVLDALAMMACAESMMTADQFTGGSHV